MSRSENISRQILHESGDMFKKQVIFPFVRKVAVSAAAVNPARLLEIGAGSGQLAYFLGPDIVSHALLTDVKGDILPVAQKNYGKNGIKSQIIESDASRMLPVKGGSSDLVTALFVLNQIEFPEAVFDLAYHYLSPAGKFVVAIPDEAYIEKLNDNPSLRKLQNTVRGINDRVHTAFTFLRTGESVPFFSRPLTDYLNWMAAAGFTVETFRLEDPDKKFPYTPKATVLVGSKMRDLKLGVHEVRMMQDTLEEAVLKSVMVRENDPTAYLLAQSTGTGETIYVPYSSKYDSAKLTELLDISDPPLLVRQTVLRASNGVEKKVYRVFFGGKLILQTTTEVTI